jgi:hypothetical protein
MNKIRMSFKEVNGNAFYLLGAFAANATRQGWSQGAIEDVQQEAMSGDYVHLLQTLIANTDPLEEGCDIQKAERQPACRLDP